MWTSSGRSRIADEDGPWQFERIGGVGKQGSSARARLGNSATTTAQLADGALVHLPNREEAIFTLDRRGFGVLRLARGRNLRLIP